MASDFSMKDIGTAGTTVLGPAETAAAAAADGIDADSTPADLFKAQVALSGYQMVASAFSQMLADLKQCLEAEARNL